MKQRRIINPEELVTYDARQHNLEQAETFNKRKRTIRVRQLNLKVSNNFYEELRAEAFRRRKLLIELLEEAWNKYKAG